MHPCPQFYFPCLISQSLVIVNKLNYVPEWGPMVEHLPSIYKVHSLEPQKKSNFNDFRSKWVMNFKVLFILSNTTNSVEMCQSGKEIISVSCKAMLQMSPYQQPLGSIMATITAVISEYLYSSINNDPKVQKCGCWQFRCTSEKP